MDFHDQSFTTTLAGKAIHRSDIFDNFYLFSIFREHCTLVQIVTIMIIFDFNDCMMMGIGMKI